MNIIYSKTTKEKLDELIHHARLQRRSIEKIELTRIEYSNLKHECNGPDVEFTTKDLLTYQGIKLEVIGW